MRISLCMWRVAAGDPKIHIILGVILRFLKPEMGYWDWDLGRGTPVNDRHFSDIEYLE